MTTANTDDVTVYTAYDTALQAYHAAAHGLVQAAKAVLLSEVRAEFPLAGAITLVGEYNEDGLVRLTIDSVVSGDGTLADDGEALDRLADEAHESLMWVGELTGEDMLGRSMLDVATGDLVWRVACSCSPAENTGNGYCPHGEKVID